MREALASGTDDVATVATAAASASAPGTAAHDKSLWPLVRSLHPRGATDEEASWCEAFVIALGCKFSAPANVVRVCRDTTSARRARTRLVTYWVSVATVTNPSATAGAISDAPEFVAQHLHDTIAHRLADVGTDGSAAVGIMYAVLQLHRADVLRVSNPSQDPATVYGVAAVATYNIRQLEMQYCVLYDDAAPSSSLSSLRGLLRSSSAASK